MSYNLTNSPSGPLGGAGMSNASTRPQGLFANGPASFNNFGKGLENFTSSLGGKAQGLFQKLFGGLFGGQGGLAPEAPPAPTGVPSLFGQPSQPGMQGAPNPGAIPMNNPVSNSSLGGNPMLAAMGGPKAPGAGAPGAGFLSRFMGGN
jgi:hypothetical protein